MHIGSQVIMHGTIFLFEQKFWIVGRHNSVLQLIHIKEKRVFPMKYNTCPQCKTKVSDDLAQCPECGHSFGTRKNRIPVVFGSFLLIAAFAGGLAFNLGSELHNAVPSAAPEIIETLAPATPVPTPTVDSIEVYAFGRELDADGFTASVGDKPFTLSAYPQPEILIFQIPRSFLQCGHTFRFRIPDGLLLQVRPHPPPFRHRSCCRDACAQEEVLR